MVGTHAGLVSGFNHLKDTPTMQYPQTLTNQDIIDGEPSEDLARHQVHTQAALLVPVQVDLSQAGVALGRAILDVVMATPELLALFPGGTEREVLLSITTIAFETPSAAIELLAYPGATVHKATVPADVSSNYPAVSVWRMVAVGPATQVVHLLVG